MSDVAVIDEWALSLREAAALLRVSYGTVYARREEFGFFLICSVWRIRPEKLREATQDYNKRRPVQTDKENKCPSVSTQSAGSISSRSDLQAVRDFVDHVAQRTAKKQRNTTSS
jgi:hypothetical protein